MLTDIEIPAIPNVSEAEIKEFCKKCNIKRGIYITWVFRYKKANYKGDWKESLHKFAVWFISDMKDFYKSDMVGWEINPLN